LASNPILSLDVFEILPGPPAVAFLLTPFSRGLALLTLREVVALTKALASEALHQTTLNDAEARVGIHIFVARNFLLDLMRIRPINWPQLPFLSDFL
jgi:hypothetical protein